MGEKTFLQKLWADAMEAVGAVAAFIPGIAAAIAISIKDGDLQKVRYYNQQLAEIGNAIQRLTVKITEVLADGVVSALEGSEVVVEIENLVNQCLDMAAGYHAEKAIKSPVNFRLPKKKAA